MGQSSLARTEHVDVTHDPGRRWHMDRAGIRRRTKDAQTLVQASRRAVVGPAPKWLLCRERREGPSSPSTGYQLDKLEVTRSSPAITRDRAPGHVKEETAGLGFELRGPLLAQRLSRLSRKRRFAGVLLAVRQYVGQPRACADHPRTLPGGWGRLIAPPRPAAPRPLSLSRARHARTRAFSRGTLSPANERRCRRWRCVARRRACRF
jgi:hypothetical protein